MNRLKNTVVLLIVAFSIIICSASSEDVTIYVNDRDGPTLALNENITFRWDWYDSDDCKGQNEFLPVLHLKWYNETSDKWEQTEDSPYTHPDNPLFIEGGVSELGEYSIRVPWYKSQGQGCNPVTYIGNFTIEEPDEPDDPNCHGCHGYEPYYGPTFVTYTTTLSVNASEGESDV